METVLIVDDDTNNVILMESFLEEVDLNVITATNGREGWNILKEKHEEIDLVLLDRMMPEMDGMEVMKRIREHPEISKIPVIMQTAASTKEQVQEGKDAGVYYYLIKPYGEEILLELVETALQDGRTASTLRNQVSKESTPEIAQSGKFTFQTLAEAHNISITLASLYPDPIDTIVGISELLINAVEHGNLGITYQEKTKFLKSDTWFTEIEARLKSDQYKNRVAEVTYAQTDESIIITITDEGEGFEWEKHFDLSPDQLTQTHGRGIPMCKHMYFNELEYSGRGNIVTATFLLNP